MNDDKTRPRLSLKGKAPLADRRVRKGPEPVKIPVPGLSGSLIKTVQLYGVSSMRGGCQRQFVNARWL